MVLEILVKLLLHQLDHVDLVVDLIYLYHHVSLCLFHLLSYLVLLFLSLLLALRRLMLENVSDCRPLYLGLVLKLVQVFDLAFDLGEAKGIVFVELQKRIGEQGVDILGVG